MIREEFIDGAHKADAALNTVWRNLPEPDGRRVLLTITAAGLEAIGIEPQAAAPPYADTADERADSAFTVADEAPAAPAPKKRGRPRKVATPGADAAPAPKTRDGTKQAQVIAMLRRREGVTIDQIVEATHWRPHTVRGFFAGALKKKLGFEVTSEKVEGRGRFYRIANR